MKKVRLVLAVLVLSVLLAACGGASTPQATAPTTAPEAAVPTTAPEAAAPTTAPATEPAVTEAPAAEPAVTEAPAAEPAATEAAAPSGEAIPITIFSPQGAETDISQNSFTAEAEAMFGIDFEWQTTTMDGQAAREARQISLASGDYPDLYMLIPWVDQFSQTELIKYGNDGVLLPLNDLIEQYGPNIKAALDKYPYFKAMATAPDGKIYGLPQLIECFHCSYPNKMWINTKWLKALNLEMPKTHEEFRAVLQAFKTQDPNGNGQADEVPLSGSTEDYGVHIIPFLMNGFIYDDDRTYLLLNDGKVDIAANKPEWMEGLAYVKSLYDEGLIDPGSFTQNADAFKMIGDNADAQLLGAGAGMHPAIFVTTGTGAPYGADYDPLPPLQGPRAAYATYNYPSSPGATFLLTNKATPEAQVAAIKLVDYMFTEDGQLRSHFGEEGVDWRRPEAGDVANEESVDPIFATITQPEGSPPRNAGWGAIAQYFQPKTFRDGWVQATDIYASDGYERRLQAATNLYAGKEPETPFPHWAVWIDPAVADEAATLRQNISDYINQNSLQFVTGDLDLATGWDAYVEGLEQNNLARYLEIMQQAYDNSTIK